MKKKQQWGLPFSTEDLDNSSISLLKSNVCTYNLKVTLNLQKWPELKFIFTGHKQSLSHTLASYHFPLQDMAKSRIVHFLNNDIKLEQLIRPSSWHIPTYIKKDIQYSYTYKLRHSVNKLQNVFNRVTAYTFDILTREIMSVRYN